jgi:hypothetical protein
MAKSSTSGQGRPKGIKNKATQELQDLCRIHTPMAIKELARLAKEAESEQARVAAINSLLDRGHGKPSQSIGLGQAPDLQPLEVVERPTLTREQWLTLHSPD